VISANSTTIPSEDAINLSASVLNILPSVNNLSASDNWAIQGIRAGPCDPSHNSSSNLFYPIGMAVFRGYYGITNVSSVLPLQIWARVQCPVRLGFNVTNGASGRLVNITSYSLQADNDSGFYSAHYTPTGAVSPTLKGAFTTQVSDEIVIYAADSTAFLLPYNSLLSSLPAVYTVAAGDEWGQIVLLHFQVIPSNNLPIVGSFFASPSSGSSCSDNGYLVPCITSLFSQALIMNCANKAATVSGCTENFGYTITVWYPYVNQLGELSGANCKYSVSGDTSSPYAHCFSVNSTAFAISPL
jgi:hypothetical protein